MLKKIFFFSFLFLVARNTNAAVISLQAESRTVGVGSEIIVDIKINTEDASINAAEATVKYPVDKLTLISAEKSGSVFNFWPEDPNFSNSDGTLRFIGGTPKGVAGASLQALSLKFKASGAGTAELSVSDAVVTASDGKGTNVLSNTVGTEIVAGIGSSIQAPTTIRSSTGEKTESPIKVDRVPVSATKVPIKPVLRVPLYPEQDKWYNRNENAVVFWDIPTDVSGAAVILDKNPNTKPQKTETELLTGKELGVVKDGTWYIHVRFKNNVGLGETSNYKINVDTVAPLSFDVGIDNPSSDNPIPQISFKTEDAFSGMSEFQIFIDGKGPDKVTSKVSNFVLPAQKPGKHVALVKAVDIAGNSSEDDLEFEILPLPTPTIEFVSASITQDENFYASGLSSANSFVEINLQNNKGQDVFVTKATTDASGRWEIRPKDAFKGGKYIFTVTARDARGAYSFPTDPVTVRIRSKPAVAFGGIELSWSVIALILVLLIGSGTGLGGWYYLAKKEKRGAYDVILERDIDKLATLLQNQLSELETAIFSPDESIKLRSSVFIGQIKENIAKMKKYLSQEAGKLK